MPQQAQSMQEGDVLIDNGGNGPILFRRKVVRRVEVPFIRKVKVPVLAKKVVKGTTERTLKSKKLVEVPDFKEVQEAYTEFKEVKKQRENKKWVEKVIPEEYVRKVPVQKTRMVRKPVTKIVEEEEYQMVTVPGTKVVEVQGFRIDKVEVKKMVEEEHWEVLELKPHNTGHRIRGEERVLDDVMSSHQQQGTQVYMDEDIKAAGIDFDNLEEGEHMGSSDAPLYGSSAHQFDAGASI